MRDGVIEGVARILQHPNEPIELPWRAERVRSSAYFAPTGVSAK